MPCCKVTLAFLKHSHCKTACFSFAMLLQHCCTPSRVGGCCGHCMAQSSCLATPVVSLYRSRSHHATSGSGCSAANSVSMCNIASQQGDNPSRGLTIELCPTLALACNSYETIRWVKQRRLASAAVSSSTNTEAELTQRVQNATSFAEWKRAQTELDKLSGW